MAAYGALISLTNTIDQIQNHPRPPIFLDQLKIEPLNRMVAFLMQFLENYIIDDDADGLEGRMIDAAHEAEDIIESYIADRIEARGEANISSNDDESLYGELEKVMHDLNSITEDVAAVKDKAGKKIAPSCTEDDAMMGSDDVMNNIMAKQNNSPYSVGDDTMMGSDDVMNDIMDKLTNQQSNRWIIAIVGMGGIGKTTLAKRIYEHPLIVEKFDIRGWATVSQEFDSKRILLQVLDCLKKTMGSEDSEYEELGQKLYQSLYGRRYLIVMDDIWSMDAWDGVKRFFPNNNDGSKVLITTRLSNVALQLDGPDYIQMRFLNQDESWKLLRRCVFQEQECPPEFEEIGKEIARNCRGLPLSIVVIGGLLAKSEQKRENWKHILENLSWIVNLEKDEHCFRILKLSYNQLPVHLKPCFLYMGMFPEDDWIHIPTLLKLWVAEGFVKQVGGKSLGTIAREVYLHGLVIRNLIMVRGCGPTRRRIKRCGIHDILRDLCIKEAEKYNFFHTIKTTHNPDHHQSWVTQHRIGIHQAGKYIPRPLPEAVQSASRARSLIWKVDGKLPSLVPFRLLKVLNGYDRFDFYDHKEDCFLPVNLRHLVAKFNSFPVEILYRLWNLQTLTVTLNSTQYKLPPVLDIWRMPQLRHVNVWKIRLKDPTEENDGVLEKLETLKRVLNFTFSEEVVERIPNIKNLEIHYSGNYNGKDNIDNLCRLRKLETLSCVSYDGRIIEVTLFPVSLRKLHLYGTELGWEEIGEKIGSLPYLEALYLNTNACEGPEWDLNLNAPEWETADGIFQSLRYLRLDGASCHLKQWRAEAEHFPRLQRLELERLSLKEIPFGFCEIPTLKEIFVATCPDSAVLSAKKILEEQEECYGKVELQITVWINTEDTQLRGESLRSQNFTVSFYGGQLRAHSLSHLLDNFYQDCIEI
ncbi:disease resistance protein [Striga asiatica]|uniref:Disease resistance protein n=1 Tax=Striga asiatica TaxID=4170 RepID=A0A5A7R7D6_STRAF|nr:disease resistance protein [Striga asiatica]